MAIKTRILTPIQLPDQVDIEIEDTIRGTKVIRTVDFHRALHELGALGAVDLLAEVQLLTAPAYRVSMSLDSGRRRPGG